MTIKKVLESETKQVSPNFYVGSENRAASEADIQEAIEAAINAKTSLADSHPSPVQRFEFIRVQNETPTGDLSNSEDNVWQLFAHRDEIERGMTRLIWEQTHLMTGEAIEIH